MAAFLSVGFMVGKGYLFYSVRLSGFGGTIVNFNEAGLRTDALCVDPA
jgi:hypothetical protein